MEHDSPAAVSAAPSYCYVKSVRLSIQLGKQHACTLQQLNAMLKFFSLQDRVHRHKY
jgi:hypothetical protein